MFRDRAGHKRKEKSDEGDTHHLIRINKKRMFNIIFEQQLGPVFKS